MPEKTISLPLSASFLDTKTLFTGLSFLSFAIPFLLAGPQLLVGTLVNTALFAAALYLPKKYLPPLVFFPSLAVLSRGLIFGPFTFFLAFFLPFIWAGNYVLILVFQKSIKLGFLPAVIMSALFKQGLLYSAAGIYFKLHLVPAIFLQSMGIFQFFTALAGGFINLVGCYILAPRKK